MTITQSAASLQYVQASVIATVGGNPLNPTGDVVQFAFLTGSGTPTGPDWKAGSWDGTQPRPPGNAYLAQCLVGPGGTVTLTPGTYTIWIKIMDSPEIPVINVGLLTIT
ncbi:hypothetical protein DT019_02915 [Streptomyces sp. SDr-06]|uniref:hypothetical protein n=1 Tax=Streptomyces sp. SDr-06 TaxID=2267702 RepID=UPI000DE9BD71|nr:hypothetical protein [Streptomyces sp. SDr-06]RCH70454.1 hypothetical protein DT019_02915 [Streptomyces sp. SDr-06]